MQSSLNFLRATPSMRYEKLCFLVTVSNIPQTNLKYYIFKTETLTIKQIHDYRTFKHRLTVASNNIAHSHPLLRFLVHSTCRSGARIRMDLIKKGSALQN